MLHSGLETLRHSGQPGELTAGVERAKATYAQNIQGHFSCFNPKTQWRGIKGITDYTWQINPQRMPSPIWSAGTPTFICSSHMTLWTPYKNMHNYKLIFTQFNWINIATNNCLNLWNSMCSILRLNQDLAAKTHSVNVQHVTERQWRNLESFVEISEHNQEYKSLWMNIS